MGNKRYKKRGSGKRRVLKAVRTAVGARHGVTVCLGNCCLAMTTLKRMHSVSRFAPCGHAVMCAACALEYINHHQTTCPLCRTNILEITRTHGRSVEVIFESTEAAVTELARQHQWQAHRQQHEWHAEDARREQATVRREQVQAARAHRREQDATEAEYWDGKLEAALSSAHPGSAQLSQLWHTYVLAVLRADGYKGQTLPPPKRYNMNRSYMTGELCVLPADVRFLGTLVRLGTAAELAVRREARARGLYLGRIQ